ncbi:hypothetical protein MHYP_G00166890 [Metynnis hypsauchen]
MKRIMQEKDPSETDTAPACLINCNEFYRELKAAQLGSPAGDEGRGSPELAGPRHLTAEQGGAAEWLLVSPQTSRSVSPERDMAFKQKHAHALLSGACIVPQSFRLY